MAGGGACRLGRTEAGRRDKGTTALWRGISMDERNAGGFGRASGPTMYGYVGGWSRVSFVRAVSIPRTLAV